MVDSQVEVALKRSHAPKERTEITLTDGRSDTRTLLYTPEEQVDFKKEVTNLKKGAKAPYQGVLFTPRALAALIMILKSQTAQAVRAYQACRQEMKVQLDTAASVCSAKMEEMHKKRQACLDDMLRREKVYSDALAKKQAFWKSPWFTGTVGFAAGVGACAGIAAAVK